MSDAVTAPTLRDATPADAEAIVAVVRAGFDAELVGAMIYGSEGAARWLRAQLLVDRRLAERVYTVAEAEGRVVGCVELRRVAGGLFLNYIATAPECRGRGYAAPMLRAAIAGSGVTAGRMWLDVFEHNARARRWYERLGFTATGTGAWWSLPQPPEDANGTPALVGDLPQAEACHAAFGFSQLTIAAPSGTMTVGRIGERWFRLAGGAAPDPAVLLTLRRLDPERHLLAILPGDAPPAWSASAELLTRHCRMECDLPTLLATLT